MDILNYALKLNNNKIFSRFKKKREIEVYLNRLEEQSAAVVGTSLIISGLLIFIRILMPAFDATMDIKYTTMIICSPVICFLLGIFCTEKYVKYKKRVLGLNYINSEMRSYLADKSNHKNLFNYLNSLVIDYPQKFKAEDIISIKLLLLDKDYDGAVKKLEDIMLGVPEQLKNDLEKHALQHYEKELNIKSVALKNNEIEMEKEYQSML